MKLTLTTIGAVAGAVALSTTAMAQQTPGSTSNYRSVQQADSQVIEGRIVTLMEYLQGSGAHASLSGTSAGATSGLSSQRDTAGAAATSTTPGASTSRTPGSSALGLGSSTASMSANQPLVLIASQSGSSASWQNRGTSGFGQDRSQTQPPTQSGLSQTQPGQSPTQTPGQVGTQDRPTFSGATPQSRVGQSGQESTGSSLASMGSGQAYILIFDQQDPQARAALTTAQSQISSIASSAESSLDRLRVRGTTDSATDTATDASERVRDLTTDRTAQSGSELRLNRDVADTSGGEKRVKVTGKVLSRGGLQAIEVASIEPASGAATPGGTQGLQDPTQPGQGLRERGND